MFQLAQAALRQLAAPGQQADPKLQEQVHMAPGWHAIPQERACSIPFDPNGFELHMKECLLPFIAALQAVSLALAALSFDFVGTCLDESSEDLGTIQVGPEQSSMS